MFRGLGTLPEYCPLLVSGSGEQVPSAVGPDLLHPALLRARVKVALTTCDHAGLCTIQKGAESSGIDLGWTTSDVNETMRVRVDSYFTRNCYEPTATSAVGVMIVYCSKCPKNNPIVHT